MPQNHRSNITISLLCRLATIRILQQTDENLPSVLIWGLWRLLWRLQDSPDCPEKLAPKSCSPWKWPNKWFLGPQFPQFEALFHQLGHLHIRQTFQEAWSWAEGELQKMMILWSKKNKVLQMCKMLRFYVWVVSIFIVGFQRLTRTKPQWCYQAPLPGVKSLFSLQ